MKDYSLLMPVPRLNTYHWFAFLLVLLNGVYVFYSFGHLPDLVNALFFFRASLVLSFFSLAFFLVFRKKAIGIYVSYYFLLALGVIAAFYFSSGHAALGTLTVLLSVLYFFSQRKLYVRVREDHISYPSLPPKKLYWKELHHVILKDGMLTIEQANDRIIQVEIKEDVNEKEFNDFCREQLGASA